MENNTANINPGRPVYFSYARNSSRKPEWEHISDCVETLLQAMKANRLEYRVDVKDIGMGDQISKFEEEIGWNSEVVVIIFSDKYFRSMHCMYEFVQIKNALKQYPDKRLMCIKSGDFNLADIDYIMELEDYWNDQKKEYEKIEYHRLRNHSGTEIAAYENGFYLEDIRNLYSFFSAINYSNAANINYGGFVSDIVKYYYTTSKPALTPKPKAQKLAKTEQRHTSTTSTTSATSTPQPATKKSPIIPIVLAAVVLAAALVIYFLTGRTTSTAPADNSEQASSARTNYDDVTTRSRPADNYYTDNTEDDYYYSDNTEDYNTHYNDYDDTYYDDYDAIFDKADELFDAGKYSAAAVYYEKLANKGDVKAQYNAGLCYDNLEDYEKAFYWYKKAAEQGNASAQTNLGCYYLEGIGVHEDYKKAFEWFQKAANQGIASAQFNLGRCYYNGEGVTPNYKKAVEWYQKAAEQGSISAQFGLGYCYLKGNGVSRNISKAKEWLRKAADQGDEDAIELLREL